ncbi:olfactory receptor 11A1 [Takifugu rubripes]|nr:olfactory receptor 11A1 [Takifugu rubripes]ABC43453.1 odorant receptor [Takifugu rubripes]|eukprot:XP_003976652.1 PREDICTED: olfactory receptor 11A1 [Takifugu rubripes]
MDEGVNVTVITLGGFTHVQQYGYIFFCLILLMYLLMVFCNCSIIGLILSQPNLQQPMYVLIAALLINSVLCSTAVHPKLLMDLVSENQTASPSFCHLQFFLYYWLAGAEFLLLACMAFDRYVSICQPLHYHRIMRNRTLGSLLLTSWLVPACQAAAMAALSSRLQLCRWTLDGIFCNNSLYKLHCATPRAVSVYGVVALMVSGIIPMFFILFTYVKIIQVSYQSCKEVRTKSAQTCLPHLLVLINFSLLSAYDIIIVRLNARIPKAVHLFMTLQFVVYQPLFNAIIYGLKMREISSSLRKLFC